VGTLDNTNPTRLSKQYYGSPLTRFEEATVGAEGCLPFISGLDAHIIEALTDVKFYEVPGSTELGDKFRDEEEKVSVLNGYSVQYTIVLNQPERTIFLFNEEHRSYYRGFERSDLSRT